VVQFHLNQPPGQQADDANEASRRSAPDAPAVGYEAEHHGRVDQIGYRVPSRRANALLDFGVPASAWRRPTVLPGPHAHQQIAQRVGVEATCARTWAAFTPGAGR